MGCKPDSVENGYLSGVYVAIYLNASYLSCIHVGYMKTWSCTGWGLPRFRITTESRELLPHDFNLTLRFALPCGVASRRAVCFCCTFPRIAPGRRYLPPFFCCKTTGCPDFPPAVAGAKAPGYGRQPFTHLRYESYPILT